MCSNTCVPPLRPLHLRCTNVAYHWTLDTPDNGVETSMHTQYFCQASTAVRVIIHFLILVVHRRPIPLISYSLMGFGILDAELNANSHTVGPSYATYHTFRVNSFCNLLPYNDKTISFALFPCLHDRPSTFVCSWPLAHLRGSASSFPETTRSSAPHPSRATSSPEAPEAGPL